MIVVTQPLGANPLLTAQQSYKRKFRLCTKPKSRSEEIASNLAHQGYEDNLNKEIQVTPNANGSIRVSGAHGTYDLSDKKVEGDTLHTKGERTLGSYDGGRKD